MDETKYREIASDLQTKIEAGDLLPGVKLPSDAELCETYAASRNTVREAVKLLQTRGLVERRGNRGTFVLLKVAPFRTVISVDSGFGGFKGAASAPGGDSSPGAGPGERKFTVNTPKVEIQEPPAGIAGELQLDKGSRAVVRHQERSIGAVLWSIQTSYYPMRFVDQGADRLLQVKDIEDGVRKYLDAELGVKEVGSHDTMRVRAPSPAEAAAFKIPDDGRIAVFETRQLGIDASGDPVRVTISVYPSDRNEFSMETGALAEAVRPQERG